MRLRPALATLVLLPLAACATEDPEGEPEVPSVTQPTETTEQPTAGQETSPQPQEGQEPDGTPRATTLVDGLAVPWGISFLPDGDAVVTERDSRRVLRVTADGEVTELGTVEAASP